MQRVIRGLVALVVGAAFLGVAPGCSKEEGKPNPDLKVPDVPAGGHGEKNKALKQK